MGSSLGTGPRARAKARSSFNDKPFADLPQVQLTVDVERLGLLALADDVVDLALDDLVVERSRNALDAIFSAVISGNYFVVNEPPGSQIRKKI